MLPAVLTHVSDLTSIVGGLAAAIAVGAFIGQSLTSFSPAPERRRRRDTAVGGLLGLMVMSGFILLSAGRW